MINLQHRPTHATLAATRGTSSSPCTSPSTSGTMNVGLTAASGSSSHTLPIVQATVSRTAADWSLSKVIRLGIASATTGFILSGSGPSKIDPKNQRLHKVGLNKDKNTTTFSHDCNHDLMFSACSQKCMPTECHDSSIAFIPLGQGDILCDKREHMWYNVIFTTCG